VTVKGLKCNAEETSRQSARAPSCGTQTAISQRGMHYTQPPLKRYCYAQQNATAFRHRFSLHTAARPAPCVSRTETRGLHLITGATTAVAAEPGGHGSVGNLLPPVAPSLSHWLVSWTRQSFRLRCIGGVRCITSCGTVCIPRDYFALVRVVGCFM